jgi:5'-nucleotidase
MNDGTARPLILLSNDDGYDAHGLVVLRKALERFAEVIVCAPRSNQSASSHALTLNSVLRLKRIDATTFAVDGTPADCIYVALHSKERVLPRRPDMVVSGMNFGPNLGVDVVYSGTVAAAREAAQRGIPALAVSADARAHAENAARLGAEVAKNTWLELTEKQGQPAPLLNLNIPAGQSWQLRATQLGRRLYDDEVIYRNDPRNREYLWIGGTRVRHEGDDGTDTVAWDKGIASLTPLTLVLFSRDHAPLCDAVVTRADDS